MHVFRTHGSEETQRNLMFPLVHPEASPTFLDADGAPAVIQGREEEHLQFNTNVKLIM